MLRTGLKVQVGRTSSSAWFISHTQKMLIHSFFPSFHPLSPFLPPSHSDFWRTFISGAGLPTTHKSYFDRQLLKICWELLSGSTDKSFNSKVPQRSVLLLMMLTGTYPHCIHSNRQSPEAWVTPCLINDDTATQPGRGGHMDNSLYFHSTEFLQYVLSEPIQA